MGGPKSASVNGSGDAPSTVAPSSPGQFVAAAWLHYTGDAPSEAQSSWGAFFTAITPRWVGPDDNPKLLPPIHATWPPGSAPKGDDRLLGCKLECRVETDGVSEGATGSIEIRRKSDDSVVGTIDGLVVQKNILMPPAPTDGSTPHRPYWFFRDDDSHPFFKEDPEQFYGVITVTGTGGKLTGKTNVMSVPRVRTAVSDRSTRARGSTLWTQADKHPPESKAAYWDLVDKSAASLDNEIDSQNLFDVSWVATDEDYHFPWELSVWGTLVKGCAVLHHAGQGMARCRTDQMPYLLNADDGSVTSSCQHPVSDDSSESVLIVGAGDQAQGYSDSETLINRDPNVPRSRPSASTAAMLVTISSSTAWWSLPIDKALLIAGADVAKADQVPWVPCDLAFLNCSCSALDRRLPQAFLDRGTKNVIAHRGPVHPEMKARYATDFYGKWDGKVDSIPDAYMQTLGWRYMPTKPVLMGVRAHDNTQADYDNSEEGKAKKDEAKTLLIAGIVIGVIAAIAIAGLIYMGVRAAQHKPLGIG